MSPYPALPGYAALPCHPAPAIRWADSDDCPSTDRAPDFEGAKGAEAAGPSAEARDASTAGADTP